MILLKEINPRVYMKGTKASRFQIYLWLGLVGWSAIVTAPLVYYIYNKAAPIGEEKKKEREEAERLKLQQITQVYEALHQQPKKHTNTPGMPG